MFFRNQKNCNFAPNINNPQSNNQTILYTDVRVKITQILILYTIFIVGIWDRGVFAP